MRSPTPLNNLHKKSRSALTTLIIACLLVAATIFVTLNRQFVMDTVHFWTYQPTAEIESIAQRSEFTDSGKFMFYVTRPQVQSGDDFNTHCDRKEQGTAILGCYVNDRIYLFDVTDERLDGIKEVTAVHEMLHAVYQRMSNDEKTRINKLIEVEYGAMRANPDFAERMAFYARTEPGERDNELHSIIGTELQAVSPELEKHYAKYISNRSKIVTLYNSYNALFLQLENEAKTLSKNLDSLAKDIETNMAKYNADIKTLNSDIGAFNSRAESGSFASQAAFNRERNALQRRVAEINTTRDTINSKIAQYETMRAKYNDTVTESHTLYESIDSTLEPAPSV